ncbi:MAG: DUF1559 domain-containing protein [Planctomycetes bacterium]|nr:DUF1559 domain-containing protein [Planctomycetota bacterium]
MDANLPGELKPSRFSLRDLLALVGVVSILLFGLAIPAVRLARDSARRTQCANQLLHIGMAMSTYHDVFKSLPPAFIPDETGCPAHSWRVLIMPFWMCDPFYDGYNFNEPWNSPANDRLGVERACSGIHYHCPADPPLEPTANYLAVVGAATAWPAPEPSHFRDFAKAASHSILLVEHRNSSIHWMEPRDLEFDRLDFTVHGRSRQGSSSPGQAISSEHRKGAHVVFADASVEFLSADTAPEVLKDMLVIGGDEPKIPLGPKKRLRRVLDPNSTDTGSKGGPYKLESYTLDETSESND